MGVDSSHFMEKFHTRLRVGKAGSCQPTKAASWHSPSSSGNSCPAGTDELPARRRGCPGARKDGERERAE